ncbi:MAG: hypothetical protein ACREP9_11810, partial [Candidatus Dormibacteraceae bacterium]
GLRCTFALVLGESPSVGLGLGTPLPPVPHLCRVPCGQLLTTGQTRGADCTAGDAGPGAGGAEGRQG